MSSSHDWPKLPHLEIIRELGRGTSGIVYLARRRVPVNRLEAVKVLLPQHSPVDRSRFECERQAVALCDHANIVRIYDAGVVDGQAYYCREVVEGTTLEHHIAVHSSIREAARIVASLAEAAEHIHAKGVIHRNLIPENVLLTKEGMPKLVGFHRVKAVFGIGPEVQEDRAEDIRALGKLLSQMVGPSGMTHGLEAIHAKCVADPPRQYQSAQDLANDLRILTA
jgi:serine/threonine protein kinase